MIQASYEVRPVRHESISILVQLRREANTKKIVVYSWNKKPQSNPEHYRATLS